ncbi:reverse transcriptase zinc-binding domain-containing protein [Tanacetum coccineum]
MGEIGMGRKSQFGMISGVSRAWPREWYDKYLVPRNVQCPIISQNMEDNVLWLKRDGNPIPYSTKAVWKDLRLMTQDMIKVWKKDDDLRCPLCKKVADSHKHLFYECEYSEKVMNRLFKSESRTEVKLCYDIKENIKNKLMSLRVKRSSEIMRIAEVWGLKWSNIYDGYSPSTCVNGSYMLLDDANSFSPHSHYGCGLNGEGDGRMEM